MGDTPSSCVGGERRRDSERADRRRVTLLLPLPAQRSPESISLQLPSLENTSPAKISIIRNYNCRSTNQFASIRVRNSKLNPKSTFILGEYSRSYPERLNSVKGDSLLQRVIYSVSEGQLGSCRKVTKLVNSVVSEAPALRSIFFEKTCPGIRLARMVVISAMTKK